MQEVADLLRWLDYIWHWHSFTFNLNPTRFNSRNLQSTQPLTMTEWNILIDGTAYATSWSLIQNFLQRYIIQDWVLYQFILKQLSLERSINVKESFCGFLDTLRFSNSWSFNKQTTTPFQNHTPSKLDVFYA